MVVVELGGVEGMMVRGFRVFLRIEKEEDGVGYGSLKESFSNPHEEDPQLVIRARKGCKRGVNWRA